MRAHQDMVFTTAARLLGDDAQAEDVAQDVFVKAFEHFAQLRASPAAGGWLRTVARHQALNHLTRYRRRWRLFSELRAGSAARAGGERAAAADSAAAAADVPLPNAALPDTLLADVDAGQRHALIEEALRRLPQAQRLALLLYHFEELSYDESAAQLHISLAKLKSDILRGRAALRAALESRGVARELADDLSTDVLSE
jgi:RNA polymerase sigma-70 factor (ECF subfamily)